MKFLTKKTLKALFLFSLIPLSSCAHVLISYIPYLIEISKQALLSLTLISGYLLNIKPEIPSQADPQVHQSVGLNTTLFEQFLQDIAKQTGIVINPEVLSQLKNAGMHHDYQKLGNLLSTLDKNNKFISSTAQNSELNSYALTQGIKKFLQPGAFTQKIEPRIQPHHTLTQASIQTGVDPLPLQMIQSPKASFSASNESKELSGEFPSSSCKTEPYLVLNKNSQAHSKSYSSQYMHHMMQQQISYAAQKALYEWDNAYASVADYFHTPALRRELGSALANYQNILRNACQMGGSTQAIEAHTQIALQGLRLPGFLDEFSQVLQEKIARLCFTQSGQWKGIESDAQLKEIQRACEPFHHLISTVSLHLKWETPSFARECIEELYLMDQGRGSWVSRFFSWVGGFLDSQAISLEELQSRIASNSYNQQVFTALELLKSNEFKLARTPLEDMTRSAKTANSVFLNQALLGQYQDKITHYYGTTNIPLKYQNDPLFWLYKPSAQNLKWDDPALKMIEAHLAIRDTIYHQIIKNVCKNEQPNGLIRHLAYGIIDKLNDPIALIDQFEFLSSDSQNAEIRQACDAFFDKGVLNLFGLKKQAVANCVQVSQALNQSQYAPVRTAINKLLLVDPRSQESKRSIKLVFDCLPYACTNNVFSKDYQNIIQAITRAHIDARAPKEILHIGCFPINPTRDLDITLLKAISKAAQEDLGMASPSANSPFSTREAWAYIQKVHDLENQGQTTQAHAIANTYLRGYIDGKMPVKNYLTPFIIITATTAGGGIWYANFPENTQKPAKIFESAGSKIPHKLVSTEETEEIKRYKSILEEILSNAKPGRETTTKKFKQYEKEGGFEQATKDFEKLNPQNIKVIPNKGLRGILPDGTAINVRNTSYSGSPTLEIYNPANKTTLKIRYN